MPQDLNQSEKAKIFIKKNKKLLFEKFASVEIYKPTDNPISWFMAGSPGAGKTEFSQALLKELSLPIVRIDADEIKKIIPIYNGANSDIVQGASSIGVDILYSYVLKKKLSTLLDGTFSKFEINSGSSNLVLTLILSFIISSIFIKNSLRLNLNAL